MPAWPPAATSPAPRWPRCWPSPLRSLGSRSPELDAALAAHAALGLLSDCVWRQKEPTRAEIERVATFCLGAVTRLSPQDTTTRTRARFCSRA